MVQAELQRKSRPKPTSKVLLHDHPSHPITLNDNRRLIEEVCLTSALVGTAPLVTTSVDMMLNMNDVNKVKIT